MQEKNKNLGTNRGNDSRDKLTLRIAKELNQETKAAAEELGVSQNNFLLVMIKLGLNSYKAYKAYNVSLPNGKEQ